MTQTRIRMVGLDLDGTLFNDRKEVTPRTVRAIRRACEAGAAVLPVTGRPKCGLPHELMDIPGVRYAITANGGAVLDTAQDRVLALHPVSREDTLLAIRVGEPFGGLVDVYLDGMPHTLEKNFEALLAAAPANMRAYFVATRRRVPAFEPWLAQETRGVEKLTMLFSDPRARAQAMDALRATGRFEVTSSIPGNLELNALGVDKGMALLELARMLDIPRAAVMACGDSSNDLAMLRAAGLGVAMGNATPEARAASGAVVASNNEDGVAEAIERYVLGDG